jgi:hypothetical protein
MSTPKAVLLTLSLLVYTSAQSAESPPFDTVRDLFAAMSAFDDARMRSAVTDDFQLLEDGEIWDIDTLISAITPGENPYVRRNFFSLIRAESNNDVGWVSYWNKATFTTSDGVSERIWLESALMIKDQGEWKLQLLHSTHVSADDMTTSVEFQEHIE